MEKKRHVYTLFDVYDKEKQNPVTLNFPFQLEKGKRFKRKDVSYRVVSLKGKTAVVQMVRYKLANTATQFVHKCPAKRYAADKMTREDIVKLEKEQGKEKAAQIRNERVKIRSLGAQTVMKCPFCKVEFYKDQFELPDTVDVDGVMKKKKLKKRK